MILLLKTGNKLSSNCSLSAWNRSWIKACFNNGWDGGKNWKGIDENVHHIFHSWNNLRNGKTHGAKKGYMECNNDGIFKFICICVTYIYYKKFAKILELAIPCAKEGNIEETSELFKYINPYFSQ